MAPIRLAIIGLSSSAVTSWASSAHLPYLLSARGRTKYSIVALCNSSVETAQKAIRAYGLDIKKTRAYGDPAALAADPDIDLVLCCTRVDTHYDLIKPSVESGKAVFVEWPLTHDVARSRELAELAAKKSIRTMVGLQGRLAPVVLKLKELLYDGSLGKILSSEVRAHGGTVDRETVVEGLGYFAEKKVGGNIFMIGFAHSKLLAPCKIPPYKFVPLVTEGHINQSVRLRPVRHRGSCRYAFPPSAPTTRDEAARPIYKHCCQNGHIRDARSDNSHRVPEWLGSGATGCELASPLPPWTAVQGRACPDVAHQL